MPLDMPRLDTYLVTGIYIILAVILKSCSDYGLLGEIRYHLPKYKIPRSIISLITPILEKPLHMSYTWPSKGVMGGGLYYY